MASDDHTSITLRLPAQLRARIEKQARAEDRSVSQFIRYHLGVMLNFRTSAETLKAARK
jgi:Arc/MetJ-type ribon-helix-helix transcriptional regulator